MKEIVEIFAQYGALGLVAAVSLYQVTVLQKVFVTLVKENTKAITELTKAIERCPTNRGGL